MKRPCTGRQPFVCVGRGNATGFGPGSVRGPVIRVTTVIRIWSGVGPGSRDPGYNCNPDQIATSRFVFTPDQTQSPGRCAPRRFQVRPISLLGALGPGKEAAQRQGS
eukprot:6134957-Pyramimonas_sp.AAC.1